MKKQNNIKNQTKKQREEICLVGTFFVLTFFISWSLWTLAEVLDSKCLEILARFGPLMSSVLLTVISGGWSGMKKLLSKLLIWKVNVKWYVFSLFSTAAAASVAIIICSMCYDAKLSFNDPKQWYLVFIAFIYVLFLSVLGEEIGWRGYALPQLQKRFSALTSAVIIGFFWGLWHLPLFFMEGDFHQYIPFWMFLIQDVALSVILTWLYNNTKGSLLISHLFHTASNVTIGILPILPMDTNGDLTPLYVTVTLLIIITTVIIAANGGKNLSKNNKKLTTI